MTVRLGFVLFFVLGILIPAIATAILLEAGILVVVDEVPRDGLALTIGVPLGLFVLAILILLITVVRYREPLRLIAHGIDEISKGNLSPELPQNAPGEFGVMSDALNTMCGQMRMILAQLSSLSKRVVDSTSGAGESFLEVNDGIKAQSGMATKTYGAVEILRDQLLNTSTEIEEIAQRIEKSASQVSDMDSAIGQVAETMDGLNNIIEKASQSTSEGDQNVRILARDISSLLSRVDSAKAVLIEMTNASVKTRTDAKDAALTLGNLTGETERIGKAIEATLDGSDAIKASNERILRTTESLESRVDRVDDVLEAIHNLAERTKLLSINASIIASEAGEHGRAFSVVAREVKELAQSTAAAISEIAIVLGGLKEGFAQTVQTIHLGQKDVDRGVRLARDAAVLLQSIPEKVHRAAALSYEIVRSNDQQVAKAEQIDEIIGHVATTLLRVNDLLGEQVARNDRTLDLFNSIRMTAERVLRSTSDHAQASGNVNRTVEVISGDFRAMAAEVRDNVTDLQNIVTLSQEALNINDSNRRRAEELSSLIGDLNRFALYLGEDFRKLGGDETQTI